jgi:hypothetical protein
MIIKYWAYRYRLSGDIYITEYRYRLLGYTYIKVKCRPSTAQAMTFVVMKCQSNIKFKKKGRVGLEKGLKAVTH